MSLGIVFLGFFCVFSGRPLEAKIIQAEIEHKDYLPEVPENFRRGQILKEGDLAVRVQWFPVPDWMAGTFMVNPALELTWNRLYIIIFSLLVLAMLALVLLLIIAAVSYFGVGQLIGAFRLSEFKSAMRRG